MNETEAIFYEYLLKKYDEKEIEFFSSDSPDFIVKNKIGYEVKKRTGGGKVTLNKNQVQKILNKNLEFSSLAIVDNKGQIKIIKLNENILTKKEKDGIGILWEKDLVPFFQKIDPKILYQWKETINQNEIIKLRLEEALKDNMEKHKNEP